MRREPLAAALAVIALAMVLALGACTTSGTSTPPSGPPATSAPSPAASGPATTPATSTQPSNAPSSAPASGAASPVAGSCGSLTSAEILQYAGITVTGTKDIGGACAYLSASGTHSAGKDLKYLAGKDGVIIGVIPAPTGPGTGACPTRPVQGAATTATVCNLPGPEFFAVFKATSGASVEINVFSSASLTDAQIDGLIAAAFGRM